jgi:hypothetical protein
MLFGFGIAALASEQEGTKVESTRIERGELSVLFADNSQSPQIRLSGLDSLFNVKHATTFDAYDPDGKGSSAGLNFEHIISGHESPHNKFTPRSGRYDLYRLDDGKSVRLVRNRGDCPWDVSSTFKYTVNEPYCVDFDFRCTPHDANLFGSRGYALFFFANYMNDVADVALNFRGIDRENGDEKWIRADAPKGHRDWNGGGTYRHAQASDLAYDADQKFVLNNWSYDFPRFTKPFYFGRAANGMTLILMFDRTWSERDEVRFSLFKFKLPKQPRPAWDFQYVIHNVQPDEQYGFRGRLVWKKFIDADDCLREYETWATLLKQH